MIFFVRLSGLTVDIPDIAANNSLCENKLNIDIFKINVEQSLARRGKEEPGGAERAGAGGENQPPWACLGEHSPCTNSWTDAGVIQMFSEWTLTSGCSWLSEDASGRGRWGWVEPIEEPWPEGYDGICPVASVEGL